MVWIVANKYLAFICLFDPDKIPKFSSIPPRIFENLISLYLIFALDEQ